MGKRRDSEKAVRDALFFSEGNFQPPAIEAQRRVLRDGELVLIEDDLFHRGVFLIE